MLEKANMIILIILIILVLLNFSLIKNLFKNDEETIFDDVKLKDEPINNGFALMVEQKNDDGTTTYVESTDNMWPSNDIYFFNNELSGCVDMKGNKLDNALSFDSTTNLVTVKTNTTTFCYLYFDIDKEAPKISIFYLGGSSNPTYATSTNTTAYISWSDTDVASYCLTTTNSSSNCTWTTTSGTSINANYTLTSGDGTKIVYAYLKDKAGNISSSALDTIILDTTAPTINSVTKTSDERTSISIKVSASDTNGIATYYYQIGSGSVVSNTTGTYTFSGLKSGTSYTIKVYVKDKAGNTSSTKSYTFKTKSNSLANYLINTVSSDELWNSTLEDDGYRYVGTDPNNYICFGTSDVSTCTGDTDKYMYRIIGIFEDEAGHKHAKLIKKEALNTAYAWNSDYNTDIDWDKSDLYKGLNGNYFLTNTSYPYMQNTTWTNKITTWNYTMTNTKSWENYDSNSIYGVSYYYNTAKVIYLHELNRSGKSSETCYFNLSTIADCNAGEWKTLSTKISLMYASDYALSLGSSALNYSANSKYSTLKTGWIYIYNNDTNVPYVSTSFFAPYNSEWTMTRRGNNSGGAYLLWSVSTIGEIDSGFAYYTYAVRPVFYLESDVELASNTGDGSITNPYIISE